MKVWKEMDLRDFKPWAGAVRTIENLNDDDLQEVQYYIEELYPDGLYETTLNDILWFDIDIIESIIGRSLYGEEY